MRAASERNDTLQSHLAELQIRSWHLIVVLRQGVMQDVFMAAVSVFAAMCKHLAAVAEVHEQQGPVRQMWAVCQLLARKADTERKYLARLEGVSSELTADFRA